ncbi:MAG: amidase domain-containing protein, partial [Turicibacter sanguinis]
MKLKKYNRQKAIDYARKWALGRNPLYHDYENYGGDCTNFISQCLHAGEIPFDVNGRDVTQKWYWYSDKSR